MIRINKPASPPAILLERGRKATEELCAAFDEAPEQYASGELPGDSASKQVRR